jgi:hypothetical protein
VIFIPSVRFSTITLGRNGNFDDDPMEIYLNIAKGKSIFLMKWAPQPLWKFMKVKEFLVDGKITSMEVVEHTRTLVKLFFSTEKHNWFKMCDLITGSMEEIKFAADLGKPVQVVNVGNGQLMFCFQSNFRYY